MAYYLKANHFWINNLFYLYTTHIFMATLTMPTWPGEVLKTNLTKLSSQQKHAMRIICNKWKFEHTKQLFQSNKILNVYKLNILNFATFMYKVNQKTFLSRFQKPSHFQPNRFSEMNYVHNIKTSKYLVSIRWPDIWNSFLSPEEKQIITMHKFKATTKSRLLFLENILPFSRGNFFYPPGFIIT